MPHSPSILDRFPEVDVDELAKKLSIADIDRFLKLIVTQDPILIMFDTADVEPTTQGMITFVKRVLIALDKRAIA